MRKGDTKLSDDVRYISLKHIFVLFKLTSSEQWPERYLTENVDDYIDCNLNSFFLLTLHSVIETQQK